MEVFNTRRLTQNQRFKTAIPVGIVAAIVLGFLAGKTSLIIGQSTGLGFGIINIGAAYLLAMIIRKVGRGVQERFSVLGGVLAFVLVLISEAISLGLPFVSLFHLSTYRLVLNVILGNGISTILTLLYDGFAIYTAYMNSRII